jgi:hypothetical protein
VGAGGGAGGGRKVTVKRTSSPRARLLPWPTSVPTVTTTSTCNSTDRVMHCLSARRSAESTFLGRRT